jgi:hypothetical protein
MKTPETLNTKHMDILLIFPTNICVPYAEKPSNGYGHWKTGRCKIFVGNWQQIELSKMRILFENGTGMQMEQKDNACDPSCSDGMQKPE